MVGGVGMIGGLWAVADAGRAGRRPTEALFYLREGLLPL